MKIVFFGTEDFSLASLKSLIDNGFDIAAVVTKPDTKRGRGHKVTQPAVKTLAIENNIPVWQPNKLSDITNDIKALQPVAGVLVSFGKIIPQSTIDLFAPGIINVHPSKLPKYRGPSPIESAILNGDTETGVSIMQLSAKMDAGPVYSFTPYQLSKKETQSELYQSLAEFGAQTLVGTLPSIIDGSLQPTEQDHSKATYCQLIQKSDGIIDWNKSAEQIEREIRAYSSWPTSRTKLGAIDVIITSAHAIPSDFGEPGAIKIEDDSLLNIQTGSGYLCIEFVKPVGKKEMPTQAFLSGYKDRLANSASWPK